MTARKFISVFLFALAALEINHENATAKEAKEKITLLSPAAELKYVTFGNLEGNIGYIKISKFEKGQEKETRGAMRMLADSKSWIIDLRYNGGGFVALSVQTAGYIVGPGKLIASVRGKLNFDYKTPLLPQAYPIPKSIVVLVNEGTASASETLAGSLRYYKMATLIGARTYGKSSIQAPCVLVAPSTDNLLTNFSVCTIGHSYFPDGFNLNGVGLKPDIEVKHPRWFRKKDIRTEKDLQLKRAIEFLKGN